MSILRAAFVPPLVGALSLFLFTTVAPQEAEARRFGKSFATGVAVGAGARILRSRPANAADNDDGEASATVKVDHEARALAAKAKLDEEKASEGSVSLLNASQPASVGANGVVCVAGCYADDPPPRPTRKAVVANP